MVSFTAKTKKLRLALTALTLGLSCFSLAYATPFTSHLTSHGKSTKTPVVKINAGKVRGVTTDYGSQYLGIPYAAAPTGDLRWQPPAPVEPWEGILTAGTVGNGCPQSISPFGQPSASEDCLYLNVYTSSRGHHRHFRKRPVMVWIHGGAFTYGEGHSYDPAKLADEGVIVVTFNYRLGALGFMAHPALSATSSTGASGNYGIMDQQAALQWVQENIRAFGGDPNNVTIFGESAGGLSVHAHLASPQSEGLFHRAIIQSGAYLLEQPSLQDWEYLGLAMANAIGCPDQSLECLRNADVNTIVANADPGALGFLPIVDGDVLPTSVLTSLATGQFNKVPVMEGTTRDEYSLFVALQFALAGNPVTEENFVSLITTLGFPIEVAALIASQYPLTDYASPSDAFTALGTDFLFSCNSRTSLQLLSQHTRTYAFEFNDPNAPFTTLPFVGVPYRSAHTTEIQYLMDPATGAPAFDADQEMLSNIMQNYWTSFARFGTPNFTFAPIWPRFGASELVKSLEPPFPQTINNFAQTHKCGFWNALLGDQ
ncbi:carboxylesterase family protein [Aurantivibrio plasticivorans]